MENNAHYYNTTIEIQPKQNLNFRYESGLKKGEKHGILTGQEGKYPKIKLTLPQNNDDLDDKNEKQRNLFVLCSLHCFKNSKTLSPHLLIQNGETELNYRFIFEQMEILKDYPLVRVWELRDYAIVRPKQEQYKHSFDEKEQEFKKLKLQNFDFAELLGPLDLNNQKSVKDSGELNVCLGFTIFEKDSNENKYSLYKNAIYSCNIYNGDDLNIHKICNPKGSVNGGTEINIFIRYESYLPLNVLIKEKDEDETSWSEIVEIKEYNKFNKSGITFTVPKYNGRECTDDEIEVLMCVMAKNTTYKSDFKPFHYVNEKTRITPKLRKRTTTDAQPSTSKSPTKTMRYRVTDYEGSEELAVSLKDNRCELDNHISNIDKIFNQSVSPKFMEAVFDDALGAEDAFIHLYSMADKFDMNYLIADFRNDNGENLLHWACKNNHYRRIRPLIGMGCHINQQDHLGRTPLHLALSMKNKDCILEIQKLFKTYSKYSKEVEVDLIKMLKAYNDNNYTVLHETTLMLADYNELFEIMLEFMQKHNMNVLDYPVLGTGDTIGHLAFEHNLLESIHPIMKKYIPDYETDENYAGIMVMQLCMDEMLKI